MAVNVGIHLSSKLNYKNVSIFNSCHLALRNRNAVLSKIIAYFHYYFIIKHMSSKRHL